MTAKYFKNSKGSPAEWESSIFIELIKENVRLVLYKLDKVFDLLVWARQVAAFKVTN